MKPVNKVKPKILVVDDEPDVCECLHSFLSRRGFKTVTTPSGAKALNFIETQKPDLAIFDLTLEDMDGDAALKILRKNNNAVKVIIITGRLLPEKDRKRIEKYGISAFFIKPLSLKGLLNSIQEILDIKELPGIEAETYKSLAIPRITKMGKDTELLCHDLANLHGLISNKCESFILNIEDGIYKGVPTDKVLNMAVDVMKEVITASEKATLILDDIP